MSEKVKVRKDGVPDEVVKKKQKSTKRLFGALQDTVRYSKQGLSKEALAKADEIKKSVRSILENESDAIIDSDRIEYIRNNLSYKYAVIMMKSMTDDSVRDDLAKAIKRDHSNEFNSKYSVDENVDYIISSIVGVGVIERLVKEDDSITDIEWDGVHLTVISNDDVVMVRGDEINVDEPTVMRFIQKFVVINKTDFNANMALFNGMYGNMRMSATHASNTDAGSTFSLRISKPGLALNEDNWHKFAPHFVYDWFRGIMGARANMTVAGETGAGKTELMKLVLGLPHEIDKFYLIEDVQEMHLRKLYPVRRIFSNLTNSKFTISKHTAHALRNNPDWIIVAETRGEEAYEMLQAMLTGHPVVTSVHAVDARAIPHRYINMCLSGHSVSEKMLHDDIYTYMDFGVFLKRIYLDGKVYRFLSEIVEYNEDGTATTLFRQVFANGVYQIKEVGDFSAKFHERLGEKGLSIVDGVHMREVLKEYGGDVKLYNGAIVDEYPVKNNPVLSMSDGKEKVSV